VDPSEAEATQRLMEGESLDAIQRTNAARMQAPQPQIDFTDDHREALANAFADAQLAVLAAVAREAQRTDSYDGPRNVARLTQALSMLRTTASGGPPAGWYAGPPGFFSLDDDDEEP
jgi:hypothetical protein